MGKKIIILLHVILVWGCVNKPQNTIQIKPDTITVEEKLFLVPAFNDTLTAFMQTIGDIPNPLNAPKVNNIIFFPNNKDTFVAFIAEVGLRDILDLEKDYLFIRGGCKIKDEYIAIYYAIFDNLNNIINEDLIDSTYIEKIISETPADTLTTEWFYEGYNWIYRLHGDSLIEVKKIKVDYGGYDYILP